MSTEDQNRDDIKELYIICNKNQAQIEALVTAIEVQREDGLRWRSDLMETLKVRGKWYDDHESRLRKIEEWKSRSTAYWLIVATVLTGVMGFIFSNISLPF